MSEEKFCKNCGKQISEDFKVCPYCGEKVEEEILKIPCPSCGKTIKSDFKVCPYCGNNPNDKRENYLEETNLNTNQSDNPIICQFCGKPKKSEFQICPHCGNNHNNKKENYNDYNNHNNYNTENIANNYSNSNEVSNKSGIVCMLLWFFLGGAGGHRFYAGQVASAFGLLALNFLGFSLLFSGYEVGIIIVVVLVLWFLIDFILIVSGHFKDSKGRYIKIKKIF